MTFHQQLIAKARATRAELDTAKRTLAALTKDDARVQAHYQALSDVRVPGVPNEALDIACKAASDYASRRRRQDDLVRDLETESAQLDTRANAPEGLTRAAASLADVRAAIAATVAKRQKSADKVMRLKAQLAVEQAGVVAGRAWQRQQLLASIEGTGQQDQTGKPESPPDQHDQAAVVIDEMIVDELAAQAQIDRDASALQANEATAETAVLEQVAYLREVEYAEALAAFAPAWTRFKAAHIAAFDFAPAAPDLNELAAIGMEEAMSEARQALAAGNNEGLLRRGLRKLADTLL